MTRYYYDCPIKALYMMKEFGIQFECFDQEIHSEKEWWPFEEFDIRANEIGDLQKDFRYLDKIYVCKAYEYYFEPQLGDWGQLKSLPSRFVKLTTINEWKEPHGGGYRGGTSDARIIMRDNKQFFMPEVEND